MNDIIDFSKSMSLIGGADGPTSVFLAWNIPEWVWFALIAAGLLLSFFGLKLVRVLNVLVSFAAGAAIGLLAALFIGAEGAVLWGAILGCAVVMAILSGVLYRFGVFCMIFLSSMAIFAVVVRENSLLIYMISLIISLILAILAVIYVEPIVIVITALFGGGVAGSALAEVIGCEVWIGCVVGGVIAVIGMGVQFAMHLRKVGKKEKDYAEEVKEKVSMELEVEKARNMLEEDEEEE